MSQGSLDESSTLKCTVTLEWLNAQCTVMRRSNLKSVTLRLIRNEFREIYLEIIDEKAVSKKYHLKGINVHKKFMLEGKASINFLEERMIVLVSNAPPVCLVAFLKHMFIKLNGKDSDLKVGLRAKLLSTKQQVLEEISPVTLKEVNHVKVKLGQNPVTPPTGKRKRNDLKYKVIKKTHLSSRLDATPLTDEQRKILEAALSGKSIFFTGSAGTGKSFLLRRIVGALPPETTVTTASTGVAACYIGGTTLHAFAGIGSGNASVEQCIKLASKPQVQQTWRKCQHLVIDEISMVEGAFFEKLENVARAVRNNDRPFGGLQLILCGDFLQLPPVSRSEKRFCFQSPAWERCIHTSFELTQVHRQSDLAFIDILQNIRIGRVTTEISDKLLSTSSQKIEKAGILATRLCSHMQDANLINSNKLEQLPGVAKTFSSSDSHPMFATQLDQQTPVVSSMVLKVGAQVMLLKNVNIADGLVNGARGVVVKFSNEGLPVVRFRSNLELPVSPERWMVKGTGGLVLSRKQIPLRLAWAFSIHKSQGLTLDCVEMSLSRVFEAGQAYVALSRAKSLDSLRVLDFDPKQVWANPDVLTFYKRFRRKLHAMQLIPLGRSKV